MENNSKISIIVPVYNPGEHLRLCVESILNQTYKNLEVIIIDDGSTDGSGDLCDSFASRDNRITVIHQENAGVSRARNIGIEKATGDFYHFPDSDDYIDFDTYRFCLELLFEYDCDAIVFEHYITYSDHEDRHESPKEYYGLYEGKDEIVKINFRTAFTCNKFFAKKLITGNGNLPGIKFREDIYRGEDSIFSRETLNRAKRVWFTDKPLYHYVQSEESACRGKFRMSQLSLFKAIDITKQYYKESFPQYIPELEVNELESCIMLWMDMYADEKDYSTECQKIHIRFKSLFQNIQNYQLTNKQIIKFVIFKFSPILFYTIHKINITGLRVARSKA